MSTDRDLDERVIKEATSLGRLLFGCGCLEVSGELCAFYFGRWISTGTLFCFVFVCLFARIQTAV